MSDYYRMPFRPSQLMKEGGTMPTCDIAHSIAHNIMLMITTKKGENRFDTNYGNDVWDVEFDNAISNAKWEKIFIGSLKKQIQEYEQRIAHPKIEVKLLYVEQDYEQKKYVEAKKKAKIFISAEIARTGERFNFNTELFLSPLSLK